MANIIALSPDPPVGGQSLSICYWWENPVPGAVVTIDVDFDDDTLNQTVPLVCPQFGQLWCATITMPPKGHTVTFTDVTGQAPQQSRVTV